MPRELPIPKGKPVVALESTIISHGMPYPKNVETALEVEKAERLARWHKCHLVTFCTHKK